MRLLSMELYGKNFDLFHLAVRFSNCSVFIFPVCRRISLISTSQFSWWFFTNKYLEVRITRTAFLFRREFAFILRISFHLGEIVVGQNIRIFRVQYATGDLGEGSTARSVRCFFFFFSFWNIPLPFYLILFLCSIFLFVSILSLLRLL